MIDKKTIFKLELQHAIRMNYITVLLDKFVAI